LGATEKIAIQPLRVFLCHSSSDRLEVRDLYSRLRADGFEPWLDEQDLLPGQSWKEEIPKAIDACAAVIVCLSPASTTKEGYLQKEIKYALDVGDEKPEGTIFIIPVKLKECDVPPRLARFQWASLAEAGGYERLVLALKKRAETQAYRSQESPSDAERDTSSPRRPEIEVHLFCGDRFAEQGEYARAIKEYENVLTLDSGNVGACRRLLRAARQQLTLEAFTGGPISIGLRRDYRNFAYVTDSEINSTLAHLYRLQGRNPSLTNDVGLLLEESLLLKTNGGRISEAIRVLERAHQLAPENSEVSAELGLLLAVPEKSERKLEGITLLKQAVENQPSEARYHFYLARAVDEVYFCGAAGLESGCGDEPQACAEAIREYRRAADLATGLDFWSRAIRSWAERQSMDIFHRYARKEGDVLTEKLAMSLDERLKELECLIMAGASYSQTGWEDDPKFWIAQLHYSLGNVSAADRQIRDLLQNGYERLISPLQRGKKYWEDEEFVSICHIYFHFFARILRETGRDPEILSKISQLLPAQV
jgi:tetratricopeptide (TPR) repeat protein